MSMKLVPELPAEQPRRSIRARVQTASRYIARKYWGASTYLQKWVIGVEDRLGWFHYQDWIRTVESREIEGYLSRFNNKVDAVPSVCFLIIGGIEKQQAVATTLESLAQAGQNTPVIFLLPEISDLEQENWLIALLAEDAYTSVKKSYLLGTPYGWVWAASELPYDWIIPLCAGDVLAPAWMEFLRFVGTNSQEIDILYWDEDEIDGGGKRNRPVFKPDWSPELLYSVNFLETAGLRKSFLAEYVRSHPDGVEEGIFGIANAAKNVIHIPFVLHHRLPVSIEEKTLSLQRHALSAKAFLSGQGLKDVEAQVVDGDVRVSWKPETPQVSIIIPTKNNLFYLQRCLSSLFEKTQYVDFEILLMDDHSTDVEVLAYYQEMQAAQPALRVYQNEGVFNYSRVNNHGARLAKGNLLLFLNNDVEILDSGWLEELVRWVMLPGVGMVGAKLLYPEGMIQHAGIVTGMTGHAAHLYAGNLPQKDTLFVPDRWYRNVSAVTGACMMVRRELFEKIGGFNENFLLVFNDVEIGLRVLQAGYRIVYTPVAQLIHYEGRSRARYIPPQDIRLGANLLHKAIKAGDRYYNPNLSLAVNWPTYKRRSELSALARLEKIVQLKG